MDDKYLIYFTVGGDKEYLNLTLYCLHSIFYYSSLKNVDILIMCDQEYSKYVVEKIGQHDNIIVYVTSPNENGVQASMRKIEIVLIPILHKYKKILYLDSDIVVLDDITKLFEEELKDDIVYFKDEKNYDFTSLYYGLKSYSSEQLQKFKKDGRRPLNGGQFLFQNTLTNRKHFLNILSLMSTWTEEFFYEQSFINHYFNTCDKFDVSLLERYVDFLNSGPDSTPDTERTNHDAIIVHCVNHEMPYMSKLHNMKSVFSKKFQSDKKCLSFSTREYLKYAFKLPHHPKLAEIGVFRGDFAISLLRQFRPYMLYLIDPYEGSISSGDQDGNNVEIYEGDQLYHQVKHRFLHYPNVTLLRTKSTVLENFGDNEFDLIYIDGDHSYDGVTYDLQVAYKKIKHMGWICGHDIMMNEDKTYNKYDFGVLKAVQEFTWNYGLKVDGLFMDGCVSYAIQVVKNFVLQSHTSDMRKKDKHLQI